MPLRKSPGKTRMRSLQQTRASAAPGSFEVGVSRAPWLMLCLVGLVLLPGPAWTQSWHFLLRNGDRVSGTVVVETPLYLTITNSAIGKLVLPVAQIEKREPFGV